jgi:hypothetical protein
MVFSRHFLAMTVIAAASAGCAVESGAEAEDAVVSEDALVTDIPESNASDYVVDGSAIYTRASVGGKYGLFRFSVGAGAPTFIDGHNATSTRSYAGYAQIVSGNLYYAVDIYDNPTNRYLGRRELLRVPTAGGVPAKVMDLPMKGQVVVGSTVLYVVTEGNDHHGGVSLIKLGAAPASATQVASNEYFGRDHAVIGDKLVWRTDWAGLTNNGLKARVYDPTTSGTRTFTFAGTQRREIQHVLVDGQKAYALGEGGLMWSLDLGTGAAVELPSLRSRMDSAGASYCGDEYPYGLDSAVVKAGKLYAYCTDWNNRARRFILSFDLAGPGSRVVTTVPTTRAWYFRASATNLFWLEKTGYDRYALRTKPL